MVFDEQDLDGCEEAGGQVVSHHGEGDDRVAEDEAQDSLRDAVHGQPLAVVDLVEEHELAGAELAADDGLEVLLVDAAELLHGAWVLLDRGGPR